MFLQDRQFRTHLIPLLVNIWATGYQNQLFRQMAKGQSRNKKAKLTTIRMKKEQVKNSVKEQPE